MITINTKQIIAAKKLYEKKGIIWLTYKSRLALTGFRTIQPCFQQVKLTWARDLNENRHLVSGQLKKNMRPWWALNLSPRYGHVILVSGFLDMTAVNYTKYACLMSTIYNGNWTEWSAIWSEIIRVISKSNERAARVRFEITSMISDQNCTTRSSITTLLYPFWNRPNTGLAELRRFLNKKRNGSDHYSSCARAIFGY